MRVVIAAKHDIAGGACRASYRLHKGLRLIGLGPKMIVLDKRTNDDSVITFNPENKLTDKVRRRLQSKLASRSLHPYQHTRPSSAEHFSLDSPGVGRELLEQAGGGDVLNIHWVSGFLDLPRVFNELPEDFPIVITLHDMNAFTGGCHYSGGCERFHDHCGHCPQLGSTKDIDLSSRILSRRLKSLVDRNKSRMRIISPSHWLAGQAKKSKMFRDIAVEVIPNSVEADIFLPHDKNYARKALGIPEQVPVIAFSAGALYSRRKGFDVLVDAIEELKSRLPELQVLSIGSHGRVPDIGLPHVKCGLVENDNLLAFCLSAADIFVLPTREDNLPNTVLEAMACGLPVVGSAVGGIPDMVQPDSTGFLFPSENSQELAAACVRILEDPALQSAMGSNARQVVLERYSLEMQATAYKRVYEQLYCA